MKKSIGIVRNVDSLGRVVIPKETRAMLGMNEGDPVEIFVNGEEVILRKYVPGCTLCGQVDKPMKQHLPGKLVCSDCAVIIAEDAFNINRPSV